MPVVNSQPSPFGHLTRERHIEAVPKRKMQSSLDHLDGKAAHGPPDEDVAIETGPAGFQRSGPLVANVHGAGDHSSSAEMCTCSETEPSGKRCPGVLVLPPALPPTCRGIQEGGPRPPQQQKVGIHPGLRLLSGAHQLRITSKAERHAPELFSSPQRRGYVISGATNARALLLATEDCNDCCFHLCGPARSCHLCLQDQEGHVILWFSRPFRMGLSCLCCCQMEMKVFTSDYELVGSVHQRCRIFSHLLEVCDGHGLATMKIHGSLFTSRCFSEQEFQVLSSTDCVVATIWKKWPGFNEACNMDHEIFGVDMVSADLSNEERACLLATAFLLNFMFFEVS